ncbi:hypothetical protein C8F01DRAFT_1236578 [Mycena amicta]|nr:hypothetical protein C8F01DRAFT_1236578 [Mycena amicta]
MPVGIVNLPLELIELIIDELPDRDSLRSCCFVASIFRIRCQKRLLAWLRLSPRASFGSRWRTYTEIAAILDVYPHLAAYVTRVNIVLPDKNTPWYSADHEVAAESILRRLTHIRETTIIGVEYSIQEVPVITEVLDRALEILRAHGTMTQLLLQSVQRLPLDIMHRVLSSAPSIVLLETGVADSSSIPSPSARRSLPGSGPIETLRVERSSTVTALLLRPEFAPYTNCLKKLSFDVRKQSKASNFALCFLATRTLECLDLSFVEHRLAHDTGSALPSHLPCLRQLALTFYPHQDDIRRQWIPPPFLISALSPSGAPVLARITINLIFPTAYAEIFDPDVLMELDEAFSAHPALENVHWSIFFELFSHPALFATVSAALQRALPKSSAKGYRLVDRTCFHFLSFLRSYMAVYNRIGSV